MKKIIQITLMILGVVFLIQLLALAWFYFTDPLNMFGGSVGKVVAPEVENIDTNQPIEEKGMTDKSRVEVVSESKPSQAQVEAAAELGITIPSFTAEQLTCFEDIFGKSRVEEIKNGAVPTALELYQGQDCL